MTFEIAFMLALLPVMLMIFVWEKIPAEITAMGVFSLLIAVGLLPVADAMQVFSNPGPITVGAMFILSAALEKCGAIDWVARKLVTLPKLKLCYLIPLIVVSIGLPSAFINNTPVVVVCLPIVIGLAKQMEIAPSKLLIPLSYAAILGGTCTLIGTSTNIVVSSLASKSAYAPFSMFELSAVGIPLFLGGTLFLSLFGDKLLPSLPSLTTMLQDTYGREYILEAFVKEDSPMLEKKIGETILANLTIVEILRSGVRLDGATKEIRLKAGDRLLIAISPREGLEKVKGLDLRGLLCEGLEKISLSQGVLVEAFIGPQSNLAEMTLDQINFRQRYRMIPLGIHRRGLNLLKRYEDTPLDYGDTLLLLGTTEAVDGLKNNNDLLLLNQPPVTLPSKRSKISFVLLIISAVVVISAAGILPIEASAIIGCMILLLFNCLTPKEAYQSIQWPILFLIFGMLGFGSAMESTDTSLWLSQQLVTIVHNYVPNDWQLLAFLASFYLMTTLLTEVISNNAAAVLFATLAISLAQSLQIDPRPFLIAITVAASASFATPIGYQTNTYVYNAGGYRFKDFARIGIPLNVLAFIISMVFIPLFWNF